VVDIFSHLDEILKEHVSLTTLRDYYLSLIPIILVQITPLSALLSTLYSIGKLNKQNEIVAMKATGISPLRIVAPLLILSLVLSAIVFEVQDRIIPQAMVASTTIKEEKIEKRRASSESRTIHQLTLYGKDNRLFYVDTYDLQQKLLQGITILEHDENQRLTSKIVARSGQWTDSTWKFFDCVIYKFDGAGQIIGEPNFSKERTIDIPEKPRDFLRHESQTEFMNYRQLKDYIDRLSNIGRRTITRLLVDLHYKVSSSLITFVIILVGIPFAIGARRSGAMLSLGLCIAISFLYYVVLSVSIALGKAEVFPPFLAAWLANILFATLGVYLIRKI
jgi:lipopolysaccharide export system permease protein